MLKTAVIEDSKAIASLYKTYLEDSEFDVSIFGSNPSEINRLLNEKGIEIIICPSYPKFQSGADIASKIKTDHDLSSSLFVISTTMQKGDLKSEWDFREINGIIVKPFNKENLKQSLFDAYYAHSKFSRKIPLAVVVDDSRSVQKILSAALKSLNFDVITASDGGEGLKKVLETHPDLILTDVEMPVMDGLELCKRISMEPSVKNTPVIVISGSIDDSQFRKGFNAGAIDFLKKPISQSELALVIESVAFKEHAVPSGTALVCSQDKTLCSIFIKVLKILNFHINICATDSELETYLGVSIPNIIILDLSEHDEKLDYCANVRTLTKDSSPVIIAVADEQDRSTMIQCFKHGVSEFITKPFGRDELRARIENHVKIKRLQDELVQKNKILESMAYKDKLTGLMNRRYFDDTLKKELERSEKYTIPLSLMIIDLDNFKQVNDRFGHDIGDTVLREIAEAIMRTVDDKGIACRYGGEEFCVIFPELPLKDALQKAEMIKRSCLRRTISEHEILQTISAGVAAYPETSTPTSLIIDADNYLYKAKQSGKNCVVTKAT